MENRDDKLIALVGLLTACLITVVFLGAVAWMNDIRRATQVTPDVQSCYLKSAPSSSPPVRP
ncbi:hypothetical protein ACFSFZ_12990 [Mixta tenebrionis]|uniref:Uncharacterized protein n=1 Tax=Mixta tenebrionis TaxID=2562439 RepID=A0A506VFV7_9GAMM|nr:MULTISPECIES: hypothetical protein [Mixta]QHM75955.1 hypothetical protein C7M52_01913 [Mixta theicola]TPW44478.1 hypothetical protein FKM52_01845 [Mixta tenebrionis]